MTYGSLINTFDSDAITKITINNRKINQKELERTLLPRSETDNLTHYRDEIKELLFDKLAEGNNIWQEKYLTISVPKKSIEEARNFFTRVNNDLISGYNKLDSQIRELSLTERLRVFHDFFRNGEEQLFDFDLKQNMKLGHDFKDYICPDSMEFKSDHFMIAGSPCGSERYGRVLFLKDYASFIEDDMISQLTDFSRNLMLSVDIKPVPTDEAVKEIQKRILALETDITRWQNKQNMNNNFSAKIPYEFEQMRKEMDEYMNDITSRDQRMMFALVTLVHTADTLEELDQDTETILSIGRNKFCTFSPLKYQQEQGLKTVLPYGLMEIKALRTITTEGTAVLMPFKTQEIMDTGGIYYGVNAISQNLLLCNRKLLLNGNGFILGVSGSGKSFAAKMEMALIALFTNDDIIVVDAEREYANLLSVFGAEIIKLSASSQNHINALDMVEGYGGDENPIILKAQFVMSLCEQLMDAETLGSREKSIIDRCIKNVYRDYMKDFKGEPPTLIDFREELLKQPEQLAQDIALALELFTEGSLNVFSHQSNVNVNSRIISYDILDLGEQLKPVGLLIMLDSILNRVIANRKKGKYTHIYIDEAHLLFAHKYSSEFLARSWKRYRKYGGLVTGITQNIVECLKSETARLMLANSEFLLLLNQSSDDRAVLGKIINASDTQMDYVINAPAGQGLIKVGASLVPFRNVFPDKTEFYKLATTKMSDKK